MRGLGHRMLMSGIERTAQADAAGEFGGKVGEDVAEHVGGDDHVESIGRAHHVGHHCIDELIVDGDVGKLAAYFVADVDEHAVGNLQDIGLVHNGDMPAAPHGQFKGCTCDAFAATARDATQRDDHIRRHQHFTAATCHVAIGIETFGVLAHYHQVERADLVGYAGEGACRADVGEQIQGLAEELRRIDFPPAFVLELGSGHRSEQQAVRAAHPFRQVRRDRGAMQRKAFETDALVFDDEVKVEAA